jgi:hypothetical protein
MARDVVRMGLNAQCETPRARSALGIFEKHEWLMRRDAGAVLCGVARAEAWRIMRVGSDVI